jgi:T5SS/PEP-CTERM-associated repeat protein
MGVSFDKFEASTTRVVSFRAYLTGADTRFASARMCGMVAKAVRRGKDSNPQRAGSLNNQETAMHRMRHAFLTPLLHARAGLVVGLLIGTVLGSRSSEAQYTNDYQTNIISGVTSNWAGDYLVGNATNFADALLIQNGGVLSDGYGYLGYGATSSENGVLVTGPGSVWSNSYSPFSVDSLSIGYYGPRNSLVINNGGQVVSYYGYVGNGLSSSNNSVLVTGGSAWRMAANLSVGRDGAGNSLVISSGGLVAFNGTGVGPSESLIGAGPDSRNNIVLVTGASTGTSSVWRCGGVLHIGDMGSGNSLVISEGGQVLNDDGIVGDNDRSSSNNSVLVTGAGSVWSNSYDLTIGSHGSGNSLIISNDGQVFSNRGLVGADGTNNYVLVVGTGSVWSVTQTLDVGMNKNNTLVISNGGKVVSDSGYVGHDFSSSGNSGRVAGGGVWQNNLLCVGYQGSSNSLFVVGGSVLATNLTVGAASPTCDNVVQLDSGSVIVTNATHDAVLEVRNGQFILNGGTVTADNLILTNGVCGMIEFNGGTLTTKTTTVANGAVLQFALGTNSNPWIANSNLTLGGTLNITDAGGFTNGTYTLFSYGGILTYNSLTIGMTPNPSLTYAVSTSAVGQVSLVVDSGGTMQFSSSTYAVNENGGTARITVNRFNKTTGTATVHYATSDGTATNGADYTAVSGTLTFTNGEVSKTFTVPIIDDAIAEANETINLTLSNPTGGVLGSPSTAILIIIDNDGGTLQFSASGYTVNENGGTATVRVNRVNKTGGTVTVDYATRDGTATNGVDYTAVSGTLTFGNGVTYKTFTVPIIDDLIYQGNLTIKLTLSNPTGSGAVLGSPTNAVLTILDNEGGVLQFSSAGYTVNEGGGAATIRVNRVTRTSGVVTVNYATSNGTATAGQDYTARAGTLTFANGEWIKTFTVPIIDDQLAEGDETINLTLSNPTGAGAALGSPKTAVLYILDNDTKFIDSGLEGVLGGSGIPGVYLSSLAWGDYDNDGQLELAISGYTGTGYITRIYKNNGEYFEYMIGLPGVYQGSVAWGDYDNDGDLDLAVCGNGTGAYITKIYRNDGWDIAGENYIFTDIGAGFTGVGYGASVAWGDYNNDGRLDLVISGYFDDGMATKILRNDGNNTFTEVAWLDAVAYSSVAWGDYDNDGYLDLVVSGYNEDNDEYIANIYRNNGDDTFTDIGAGLPGVGWSSVAWGDYDNDGYLDLAICGNTGTGYITRIYRNNGDGTFTDIGAGLTGVYWGSVAWGDYDNDGYIDLAICGSTGANYITKIYKNNGDDTFTDIGAGLTGVGYGASVAWGDYDNDGYLDLAICGYTGGALGPITRIYTNNRRSEINPNTVPSAPTNLAYEMGGADSVILKWASGSDAETPDTGLYYNLRVGTSSGAGNIVSGVYGSPLLGNYLRPTLLGLDYPLGVRLQNLPVGLYYWSVQTIDTGLAASPWSDEQSFPVDY